MVVGKAKGRPYPLVSVGFRQPLGQDLEMSSLPTLAQSVGQAILHVAQSGVDEPCEPTFTGPLALL